MKHGFTLSEILITLGIVGVVAVLTVPSVMKNYRNRMYVAQLQKIYSQINDAAQAIMNDEHVDSFYETSAIAKNVCTKNEDAAEDAPAEEKVTCTTAGNEYFLTKYFKNIKKNCSQGNNQCVGSNYTALDGQSLGHLGGYCVQTVNGATVCSYYHQPTNVLNIAVDVNGPAEPNIAGRDFFTMDIKRDGSLSDYGSGSNDPSVAGISAENCGVKADIYRTAAGCLTSVIEAGWKMEY